MTNQKAATKIKMHVNQLLSRLRRISITYSNRGRARLSYITCSCPRQSFHESELREDSSSNSGSNNSGGPAARRKKTDFKDNISEFGAQLPPPTPMWKSLC